MPNGGDDTSTAGGSVELIPAGEGLPRDRLLHSPPDGFSGLDPFSYVLTAGWSARNRATSFGVNLVIEQSAF